MMYNMWIIRLLVGGLESGIERWRIGSMLESQGAGGYQLMWTWNGQIFFGHDIINRKRRMSY